MAQSTQEIIIDELLTFVQNKSNTLDEHIVQICVSNFTDSEIEKSKATLVNSLSTSGSRTVNRKGEDTLQLFKESDPAIQPFFVARNLNRLPPVSFDHVDISRLLKVSLE